VAADDGLGPAGMPAVRQRDLAQRRPARIAHYLQATRVFRIRGNRQLQLLQWRQQRARQAPRGDVAQAAVACQQDLPGHAVRRMLFGGADERGQRFRQGRGAGDQFQRTAQFRLQRLCLHAARVVDHYRSQSQEVRVVVAQRAEAAGDVQQRAIATHVALVKNAVGGARFQPGHRCAQVSRQGRINEVVQGHAEQLVGTMTEHRAPALVDVAQAALRIGLHDAHEVLVDEAAVQLSRVDVRRKGAQRQRVQARPGRQLAGAA
jgi:hypothetical protein